LAAATSLLTANVTVALGLGRVSTTAKAMEPAMMPNPTTTATIIHTIVMVSMVVSRHVRQIVKKPQSFVRLGGTTIATMLSHATQHKELHWTRSTRGNGGFLSVAALSYSHFGKQSLLRA
jgi:hypothetical protein